MSGNATSGAGRGNDGGGGPGDGGVNPGESGAGDSKPASAAGRVGVLISADRYDLSEP